MERQTIPDRSATTAPRRALIAADALDDLLRALTLAGFRPVGPVVRDGAIVLDELGSAGDLPHGRGVETGPGRYRLTTREDGAVFGHSAGPQSWKQFLHPARRKLWDADRAADGSGDFTVTPAAADPVRHAFIGVRPCDLAAIRVLGRTLSGGRRSASDGPRDDVFVVAVECTEPGATCFCSSMGTGPGCVDRTAEFDLALVEIPDDTSSAGHRFLVTVGSERGGWILDAVPHGPVDGPTLEAVRAAVDAASGRMGLTLPDTDIRALLTRSRDSAHWDDVASRCLTCGNCTMVCPTCFCTSTEDVSDLTGDHAERWESWDSCFDIDYSYIHGGAVRTSPKSRYRQWLTHKFGTWHDQFGQSGCVGCGRCVAWCPAGIDVTAELTALAGEAGPADDAAEPAEAIGGVRS